LCSGAAPLLGPHGAQHRNVGPPSLRERCQALGDCAATVLSLACQPRAIEVGEHRLIFGQQTLNPGTESLTLEVCQTLVNHYELIKGHDSDPIASMGPRMPEPDFSRASPSGIEVEGLSRKGIWQGDESAGWCPGRFLDTASVLAPSPSSRFDRN
jgi:hypothetical protein